ncbi:uncharacterized protein METZ01_LOCUS440727 [marine metagenome]|uniref:Uncharacterized protein n=1 Tax=marine metagenome TaxID=408172 RepID=A0A382YXF4_9ZZZZ
MIIFVSSFKTSLLIFKPLFFIILLISPLEFASFVLRTRSNILIPLAIVFFLTLIIGRSFPIDLSTKVFCAVISESLAAFTP